MTDAELSLFSNPVAIVGLVILALFEFGLFAWALFDWIKRPADRIKGNRILWLLLLAFVNIIGPVLYLTLARLPEPALDSATPVGDRSGEALDSLYGAQGTDQA